MDVLKDTRKICYTDKAYARCLVGQAEQIYQMDWNSYSFNPNPCYLKIDNWNESVYGV